MCQTMLPENMMLHSSYDYRLVSLSVVVAICACYAALDLAGRIAISSGRERFAWLFGGATAMGTGIWSMHYIGMLAFRLPIPIRYNWPIVLVSLAAAILASAVALFVAGGTGMNLWRALVGSVVMGAGIGAMHYIGMAGMRMAAMCHFDAAIVSLSVVLAIGISFAALWLVFLCRKGEGDKHRRKMSRALIMGSAIPILHYTGMAAATFTASPTHPDLSHAVDVSTLGTLGIAFVTMMVLALAMLTSAHDRLIRQSDRSMRVHVRKARVRAARAAIVTACIMFVFEVTKQALQPTVTVWASHFVTIAFTTALAAGLSFLVLTKEERIRFELASSEERYRSLFERSLAGVFRTTLQGRILDCNDAFCRILGYGSTEELLDKSATDVYPCSLDRERFTIRLRSAKVLTNFEHCLRRKDGSQVWVLENATLFETDDLRDPIVEGTITDITERRRAEEDLRRLAAIVRCSDDAIISKNTDGIIETWNGGAERIYGYPAEEVIGKSIAVLGGQDRADEIQQILQTVRSGKEVKQFETVRRRKDGRKIDIALTVSPIKDATGSVVGASTIARDITERKRAERALRKSEIEYRLLFEGCPIPMWVFDQKTLAFLQVNEAAVRRYGYSREEFLSMSIADIRPEEDVRDLLRATSTPVRGLQEPEFWRHRKKDGSIIEVEIVSHDLDFDGIDAELVAAHDITERRQAEQALRTAEERYRRIFEDAVLGIFQATPTGRPISINRALAQIHGYASPDQLLSEVSNLIDELFVNPSQMADLRRELEQKGVVRDSELEFYRRDRSKGSVRANLRAVRDAVGNLTMIEGTIEDITERKRAEEQVQFLAYYDALTGLPNRTLLQDRMGKALAAARRHNEKVALLFLDLDQFKTINDSLGHSFGDQLLQEVGERLKKWGREQDTVARIGGDEFVLALTGIKDVPDAAVAAERIMDAMTKEFVVQDRRFTISCSVGISIYPDHGVDSETLIKNADAAMYCAKESGRSAFRFFTEEMNAQVVERLNIEHNLRLALEKNEFFLVYQPQNDIGTGKIIGMEALLRWKHPELGLVPPDKFIRVAENTGLILPIGEWVLRAACSAARRWQDEGLPAIPIAVNVSAVQFRQEGFRELVRRILQDTGLAPEYLELELTEGLLLSTGDMTFPLLQEFKAMGVRLAIDDFGTGYSSLSYLRQFPVNKLKIDRSFIRAVAMNADDAAITAAVISMGRSLNLKVIAEGVEDEKQVSFLRAHQCDEMQGYYFSKPLPAKEFAEKLRSDMNRALSAHGS
jgi:diguanylate cyclase (GGDEF)-like protein/PAS domain S-box-containing protein